ncbi:MOSC domain-containing protein [Yinghuangia seranimata]|uniref:MOSC domain-containing protein n=1 Tax=Yinghuangia seranimata TaxID=408067 RepID=UPI00248B3586|nr:MOSC domain-containing protein [Yinghuangia seranimata]MDI2130853.1 MOSC domain-containing protein [Yinghuangia seranimata]
MTGRISSLYVYPIKGLSPQPLPSVTLTEGHGFPHDRVLAFARPEGRYRPGITEPLPKAQFFMLAKDARLAGLRTDFDPDTGILRVRVREHLVLTCDMGDPSGVDAATAFFGRVLDRPHHGLPVLARGEGRRYTDVSVVSDAMMNAVSLINLASVRDLQERVGAPVDPLRFRANVYFDGMPAFSELDLVGKEFTVGGLRMRAVLNTRRCAATEVNPATASRDLSVPRLLVREYGHDQMGVYAEVLSGGTLRPGDVLDYPLHAPTEAA